MQKEINLGKISTKRFDEFLILSFSKKWLSLNDDRPIEFDVQLSKNGRLVLSSSLAKLNKKNKVVIDEM